MKGKPKVIFIIEHLGGGGAERVLSILTNHMVKKGFDVEILLTACYRVEYAFDERIKINCIYSDNRPNSTGGGLEEEWFHLPQNFLYAFLYRVCRKFFPKLFLIIKYCQHERVKLLRKILKKREKSTLIAFSSMSSIFTLLANHGLYHKVIITERSDPAVKLPKGTETYYLSKIIYPHAKAFVIQTPDVKKHFPDNIQKKCIVIPNPLDCFMLPERYTGKRKPIIVNFCRLVPAKNLFLLLKAFSSFYANHPEYQLYIYGEGSLKDDLNQYAKKLSIDSAIKINDFCDNIHEQIVDFAMYVSSSDFEGLSNSMLEALAIGLPSICTNCPVGGPRFIIKNMENGILVPIKNSEKLSDAMNMLANDEALSDKLSSNAIKIKEKLSVENICLLWESIL